MIAIVLFFFGLVVGAIGGFVLCALCCNDKGGRL